ncbi:MAG: hypothetical protein NT076_03125 [Candidatus Pacearchaeota archaeon]|nr:hypothetical protein [Candidatus Pacearchaeota archaeon]
MVKDKEKEIVNLGQRNFVITKKIASHGSQTVIIVPKCLSSQLKPGMLAEIKINLIGDENGNN